MLYFVTYITHKDGYFPYLEEKMKDANHFIVLGYGQPWISWYHRIQELLRFCATLEKNDIVCCIDGFDTIVNNVDISEIEKEVYDKFEEKKADIVFSKDIDKPTHIFQSYYHKKVFGLCDGSFLNAGMCIGKVHAILRFWENIKTNDDDQRYASYTCTYDPRIKVKIDKENTLFWNYDEREKYRIDENNQRLVLAENFASPVFISAPGRKKRLLYLLKDLGYDTSSVRLPSEKSFAEKQDHYLHILWSYFSFEIFLILIPIFLFLLFVVFSYIYQKK